MKKIIIFLVTYIIFNSCGIYRKKFTHQTFKSIENISEEITYSPLVWESDSIGNEYVEKTSFFVPVFINGINQKVFMQFDLGASVSMFYENTIKELYKEHNLKMDTLISKKGSPFLSNCNIKINDNIILLSDKIYIRRNYGSTDIDSTITIIGTIGYDILSDNILILDFNKNRYALTDGLPEKMKNEIEYIEKTDLKYFPIILPFRLGEKKIRLMYDTGSSMFPILTGTKRVKKISKNKQIDKVGNINSWGNSIAIYRQHDFKDEIGNLYIGNIDLGKIDIYGTDILNKLSFAGNYLYGITGNKVFEDKVIIINRKNNKFGIIN